jgi:hypothetical protein
LPHFRLDIDRDWNVLWRKPVVDAEAHQPALLKGSCCTSAYRRLSVRLYEQGLLQGERSHTVGDMGIQGGERRSSPHIEHL